MQVFISYSHSDSPLAARVSKALRKAGPAGLGSGSQPPPG